MATHQLITVRSETTTLFARFVGFVGALVTVLMQYGLLAAEHGEKILGVINSPKTAVLMSILGTAVAAFGPSILGWRNKNKELPAGVGVKDVQVKDNAPESFDKSVKLNNAASKLSLLIFACFMTTALAACSASCPTPPASTYYSTNAYPAMKIEQMREIQGQ